MFSPKGINMVGAKSNSRFAESIAEMQTHRLVLQSLRPLMRSKTALLRGLNFRYATTAVSGEILTRTPYTRFENQILENLNLLFPFFKIRPGYLAQWSCMVLIFLKNQLLMRLIFAVLSFITCKAVFGTRFHVDYDEDSAPAGAIPPFFFFLHFFMFSNHALIFSHRIMGSSC